MSYRHTEKPDSLTCLSYHLLLQGVCSTPSKGIAMPLFNHCRKLRLQNFQKSTAKELPKNNCSIHESIPGLMA
ncbi:MAG: hypothetical protein LBE84_12260, partial [Planctomycetota bacterium]|nr:hypothetical protein [Planctomycetota bacterium]